MTIKVRDIRKGITGLVDLVGSQTIPRKNALLEDSGFLLVQWEVGVFFSPLLDESV